ncbi:MAG: ferrous iron transport protein A [Terriglobales bacterium]|jgi:Fe2+ transport system protein FeoA
MAEKPRVAALADLPNGYAAVVATVDDELAELIEIGFVPGAHVRPTHAGVGGDPRVYELDGTLVALRYAAARHVRVTLPHPGRKEGD